MGRRHTQAVQGLQHSLHMNEEKLRRTVCDHNIRRLDVSVHNLLALEVAQLRQKVVAARAKHGVWHYGRVCRACLNAIDQHVCHAPCTGEQDEIVGRALEAEPAWRRTHNAPTEECCTWAGERAFVCRLCPWSSIIHWVASVSVQYWASMTPVSYIGWHQSQSKRWPAHRGNAKPGAQQPCSLAGPECL